MMRLHIKSGLINLNRVINWFSHSTWYVWLFFEKCTRLQPDARVKVTSNYWIKMFISPFVCRPFLDSFLSAGFWGFLWVCFISIHAIQAASYKYTISSKQGEFSGKSSELWNFPPVTAAHFWHFLIFNQWCLAWLWSLIHNTDLSDKPCVKSWLIWQE